MTDELCPMCGARMNVIHTPLKGAFCSWDDHHHFMRYDGRTTYHRWTLPDGTHYIIELVGSEAQVYKCSTPPIPSSIQRPYITVPLDTLNFDPKEPSAAIEKINTLWSFR